MRRKSKDKVQHEADTIGYMPERFIEGYFELVRLGLQTDPHGQQFDSESTVPKKKYHAHAGGLRDEPALRFKAWVDRQLRAIGRDVQAYLNARDSRGPSPIGMSPSQRREIARELERKTELKCHGCGKYISWQWNHCAWCGKEVHSEEVSKQGNGSNERSSRSSSEPPSAVDFSAREDAGEDTTSEVRGNAGQYPSVQDWADRRDRETQERRASAGHAEDARHHEKYFAEDRTDESEGKDQI